jgi:predicted nucleic acid-binding protein
VITAVDSNVLIDILGADPQFGPPSLAAAKQCRADGILVACDLVWAEVVAAFADVAKTEGSLARIPVEYSAIEKAAATRAGTAWREYRRRGGPRERLVTDFIVGAHAREQADRLLTRDRGFHRAAFAGLKIIDPSV